MLIVEFYVSMERIVNETTEDVVKGFELEFQWFWRVNEKLLDVINRLFIY